MDVAGNANGDRYVCDITTLHPMRLHMSTRSEDSLVARRDFLGKIAAGAALVGTAPMLGATAEAMPVQAGTEPWLSGISAAKHKAVFDATTVNDGFAFIYALNYVDTMNKTYMLRAGEANAVVVIRHFGIGAGFS